MSNFSIALNGDPTQPDYLRSGGKTHFSKKPALRSSDYNLSMIMIDNGKKSAVINNQIKSENARIGGAKILKIKENSVVLLKAGKRLELNLIKGIGKK